MAIKPLSQRDKNWADKKLGSSTNTTIGSHGCTITCVAMLAGLNPDEVNDSLNDVGGYANTNLIVWTKIKQAIPWLNFEWRGYSYDNDKVKEAIDKYGGCLVEVSGKRIGGDKHWVLFIGNKQMIDPWTGSVKSTEWYGAPTGYSTIAVDKNNVKPLPNELEVCMADRSRFWQERDEARKLLEEEKNRSNSLLEETKRLNDALQDSRKQLSGEKTKSDEYKKQYQDFVDKVAAKIGSLADEANIMQKLDMDVTDLDNITKKAIKLEQSLVEAEKDKKTEIAALKDEIARQNVELEKLKSQNKNLITRLENLETKSNTINSTQRFLKWFNLIFKKDK